MKVRNLKGLKPSLIKYGALLMGICYLMNPLQQQVFDVFHVVSHALELPDNLLSHETNHLESLRVHKSESHHADVPNHNHEFIDLVKVIFKASNEDHQTPDESIVKVKCDKHLGSNELTVINPSAIIEIAGNVRYVRGLKIGYPKKWERPPQNRLC